MKIDTIWEWLALFVIYLILSFKLACFIGRVLRASYNDEELEEEVDPHKRE